MQKNIKNFKNKIKNYIIFLCCLIIILISAGSVFTAYAVDYENHWARPIFDEWIRLGILKPDTNGNIRPDEPVSRGELCSYINKIMGYVNPADISKYADTPPSSRFYWDMSAALNAGYIEPTSPGALSPANPMTREQVISVFVKVAKINPAPEDMGILAWVRDASQISNDKLNLIASSVANGFIAGREDFKIEPKSYMTVSETIVLLDRLNSGKRIYAFPGVYGPAAGNVISNYTTVMSSGVNLNNANIANDLDIHSNAGDGDIYLNSDNISRKLLINGGKNIYISKLTAEEIEINKKGARLIYTAGQNSAAGTLVINSDDVIVDINKGNITKKIIINGKNAVVNIGENVKIAELEIYGDNAVINLAKGARIEQVVLNAKAQITGLGTIGVLNVNPGGDGSVVEPKPDKTNIAENTNVIIDNKNSGATNPKIIAGSFLFPVTVKVNTEDAGSLTVTKSDFKIEIDGAANSNFTVTKISSTEFNIILPVQISASTQIKITGVNNLTGTITISQDSQSMITEAVPADMKTILITLTNSANKAFSKENFQVQIAGKNSSGFMVTAQSPTLYNLVISDNVKSGQIISIAGQNGLGGFVTVGVISAVKSIIFEDDTRLLANTDDTSGNKIAKDCFEVTVAGNSVTDFTVTEKSKTSFEITLPSKLSEGTAVSVHGKKYLSGKVSSDYSSPFNVSKVTTTDKKNITVVLSSAPTVSLTAEKNADSFQVYVNDTRIPVTAVKKDAADKKGATFNLAVDLTDMQGILTVNRTKESKNKGVIDFVDPVFVAVRMNDKYLNENPPPFRVEPSSAKLIAEFSEPVYKTAPSGKFSNKDVALSGAVFNIISGNGSGFDPNGVKVTISANSVIIDLSGAKRMDPGIYTLTIDKTAIFDSFGNVCGRNSADKVSFKFDIIGSVPTAASAKQTETGNIEIKLNGNAAETFGNAMSVGDGKIAIMDGADQIGKDITFHFISYDSKSKTLTISRDALPPYYSDVNNPVYLDKDTYKLIFIHPDFVRFEISKIKIDTKKPKIIKVALKETELVEGSKGTDENPLPKISKSNAVIQIEFSEPVFAKPPSSKFSDANISSDGDQAFNIIADDLINSDLKNVKISSNNRSVTISLITAGSLEPDVYMLKIDGGLIFDSVGNPVDASDSSVLKYYFNVISMPPVLTSARQTSNGDIRIRVNSKPQTLSYEYRHNIYEDGIINIYHMDINENGKRVKNPIPVQTIASSEFLTLDDVNHYIFIKREGLDPIYYADPGKLNDWYVIEFEHYYYETAKTPELQIHTEIRTEPNIYAGGGSKNIPLSPVKAEDCRITIEDAVIKINFGMSVKNINKTNFTAGDFKIINDSRNTGDAAFTLFILQDGNEIPVSLGQLKETDIKHSGSAVSIDLRNVLKDDSALQKSFIFSVNEALVIDANKNGVRLSNEIDKRYFKLSKTPLQLKSAEQIAGSGDIEIVINPYDNDPQYLKTNEYGSYIDGTASSSGEVMSTVRIEQDGIIIGYIPGEYIFGGVNYNFSEKKITISKNAADKLVSLEGNPVTLDGRHTLVLAYSDYADNRIDLKIDTAPPILKGEPKATNIKTQNNAATVSVTFTFNEPVQINSYSVLDNTNNSVTAACKLSNSGMKITVVFELSNFSNMPALADYKINLTVRDKFTNETKLENIRAVPLELHPRNKLAAGEKKIQGFEYNSYALNPSGDGEIHQFLLEKSNDFSGYYDVNGAVTDAALINMLNGKLAAGPADSDTVTLQCEMIIKIPDDALKFRYTQSKVLTFGEVKNIGNSPSVSVPANKQIQLYDEIEYKFDEAGWAVNVPNTTKSSGYYIFEWTTKDTVYYTYVISGFNSYEP